MYLLICLFIVQQEYEDCSGFSQKFTQRKGFLKKIEGLVFRFSRNSQERKSSIRTVFLFKSGNAVSRIKLDHCRKCKAKYPFISPGQSNHQDPCHNQKNGSKKTLPVQSFNHRVRSFVGSHELDESDQDCSGKIDIRSQLTVGKITNRTR